MGDDNIDMEDDRIDMGYLVTLVAGNIWQGIPAAIQAWSGTSAGGTNTSPPPGSGL
jgi:hypothetical protein